MKHSFNLPTLLVALLVTLGVTQLVPASAQRQSLSAFQVAALVDPTVSSVLRDLASGNVIGGPLLVEATGPITGRLLFGGGNATDVALTIQNIGTETIDVTGSTGTFLFSVLPGENVARVLALNVGPVFGNLKWNCVGGGQAKFMWVGRSL